MRHYAARQIERDGKPTGLWHYTVSHSGGIFPVGYCAADCPGHATPDEAYQCYRKYRLDKFVTPTKLNDQQKRCLECGEWTQDAVMIDENLLVLCAHHQGREILEKHFKT